jgi:ParB-like chromosome segregation protein Spo0J
MKTKTVKKNHNSLKNKHQLKEIEVSKCLLLERNPQYLTPHQMDALKKSIERDGFVAPILIRISNKHKGKYEVVSGNHRFMAAQELGYKTIPAVVANLSTRDSKRLALNLNLIHGDPLAEQLAPFLADLDDETLGEIHLEGDLLKDVLNFDDILGERLKALDDVPGFDQESVNTTIEQCICPKCGKHHIALKSAE